MLHQNWPALPLSRRRVPLLLLALFLAVAGVTFPLQAVHAGGCTALLPDGGFESGTGWIAQSSGGQQLLSPFQVHSGRQAAYLGGANLAQDRIATTVSLPADQLISLRFWSQVRSDENGSTWDGLSVSLSDVGGSALATLFSLDNGSRQGVWRHTSVDLSGYAGQTVQLVFAAQTDATLVTEFFIDDVELTACDRAGSPFRIFLPIGRR